MNHLCKRLISVLLSALLVFGLVSPAAVRAEEPEDWKITWGQVDNDSVELETPSAQQVAVDVQQPTHDDAEILRVSIVLEDASTISAGFSTRDISDNASAMSYRESLREEQEDITATISRQVLGGEALDVVWNLTLAANIISANVPYGKIAEIEALPGVKRVVIENRYDPAVVSKDADSPNMAAASQMTGSPAAWAQGYTGAGSRIAIIDTGVDDDHELFAAGGLQHAFEVNAAEKGMTYEEYVASLNLLTQDEISAKWSLMNAKSRRSSSSGIYRTLKIAFGFNYVDKNTTINHDSDSQGEHGSHVTGIATGNRFVLQGSEYVPSLTAVNTQGVAPDAQIVTMKVFGKGGGAYDSDYMAAIEDAIILNCDSVNLSLGSSNPGSSISEEYQNVMDSLTAHGTVVAISAGNNDAWAAETEAGYTYADDNNFDTVGSPGSYTNSLAVASVDNDGGIGTLIYYNDMSIFPTETQGYGNALLYTIAGEHDFVFVNSTGSDSDFSKVSSLLSGKIALCFRGTSSFYEKANAAAKYGAIATIVVNNQPGSIAMDLTNYSYTKPVVSITQNEGLAIMESAEEHEAGGLTYYTGKLTVGDTYSGVFLNSEYFIMSDFSSWGVPGSLTLKPEITAPGGSIYSVDGATRGGKAYETMSGTSMAAPHMNGMAAVLAQYIRENDLTTKTGLTARQLINSLMMSTSVPIFEEGSKYYYSVLKQGSGLGNINNAISAGSYILMDETATASYADGKVKVELGDDPARTGTYSAKFYVYNLSDEQKDFSFSADFFTQDIFTENGIAYRDTWTTPLNADVTFTVTGNAAQEAGLDPARYDFDGDGHVDADDGQFLLDYIVGNEPTALEGASTAYDLSEDGNVTTYDAKLFFELLGAAETYVVPADGAIEVTCTFTLNDISDYDINGAGTYIEGFIFAEEIPSDEGVIGTRHSIPVLGYYGGWTDFSMFDHGNHMYFEYAPEGDNSYFGASYNDNNSLQIKYAGENTAVYFGGNPIIKDAVYMPERDAMNAVSGDTLTKFAFSVTRNAANGRLIITDEDGTVLKTGMLGAVDAAYYDQTAKAYQRTGFSTTLNYAPAGVQEGKKVTAAIQLAPEYYADAEGSIDWDSLGKGASLAFTFTVDNTAPVISDVSEITSGDEVTGFSLTVQDNLNIAAVCFYNEQGKLLDSAGSDPNAAAGASAEYVFDTVSGTNRYYVRVYDYARNYSTYKMNLNHQELEDSLSISINPAELRVIRGGSAKLTVSAEPWGASESVTWSSSDESVATVSEAGVVSGISKGTATITAVSTVNPDVSATCPVTVYTIPVTINGALQDAEGNPELFSWNFDTDETWTAGAALDNDISAVAWNSNAASGNMYQMDSDGRLYQVNRTTGEVVSSSADVNEFGGPVDDMAVGNRMNTYQFAIYYYYILYSQNMANTFTSGFSYAPDQRTSLNSRTGADFFTAFAYGYTQSNNDYFYAMDNLGYIWLFRLSNSTWSGLSLSLQSTTASDFTGRAWPSSYSQLCSMVCDSSKKVLFLSYFTGATNEIYMLELKSNKWVSTFLGEVGDGVWPAALYSATLDSGYTSTAVDDEVEFEGEEIQFTELTAEDIAAVKAARGVQEVSAIPVSGTLNAVSSGKMHTGVKASSSAPAQQDGEFTVAVTAADAEGTDVSSYNGLAAVEWDDETLTGSDFAANAAHYAVKVEDGKITFAYVDLDGIAAGNAVATLKFTDNGAEHAIVDVTFTELGDASLNAEQEICLYNHSRTEVRGAVEATCETVGYEGDTYCLDCGKLVAEGEEIPFADHDYQFVGFEWDGYTAKAQYVCSVNSEHTAEYDAEITSEITTPATCEEAGVRTYTATYDGHTDTKTEEVPALDHDYQFTGFEWADDFTAKAVYTCANDGTHVQKFEAEVTSEVTAEPDCTAVGTRTYTATYDGHTDTKTEDIPALGHFYSRTFTWTGDPTDPTCTVEFSCEVCDYSFEAECEVSCIASKDATCTEDGYMKWKATCEFEGKTYKSAIYNAALPALGHDLISHDAKAATCLEGGWDAYETCSRCDYTTQVLIDPHGHTPAEAVRENEIPATCSSDGSYDSVVYCETCGAELSRETVEEKSAGHNFVNHLCECGLNDFTVQNHSCSCNNDLSLNYYIPALAAGFDNVYMEFTYASGAEAEIKTIRVDDYSLASVNGTAMLRFAFDRIAAAEMGRVVSAVICVEKDGKVYTSAVNSYSVSIYAYNRIEKSASEEMKALMVALLNYGAAAQTNFGVDADALVNADLAPEDQAVADIKLNSVSGSNETENAKVKVTGRSCVLDNAIDLKFYVTAEEGADIEKTTVTVRYKTIGGSSKSFNVSGSEFESEGEGKYSFRVKGIAAPNFGQTITIQIVESGVRTATYTYSIESYCSAILEKAENDSLKNLCTAMMAYSRAAAEYFK